MTENTKVLPRKKWVFFRTNLNLVWSDAWGIYGAYMYVQLLIQSERMDAFAESQGIIHKQIHGFRQRRAEAPGMLTLWEEVLNSAGDWGRCQRWACIYIYRKAIFYLCFCLLSAHKEVTEETLLTASKGRKHWISDLKNMSFKSRGRHLSLSEEI